MNHHHSAALTKEEWVKRAAATLDLYEFDSTTSYAENLYETYVVEGEDYADDPEGAVDEDMTYWGD